MSSNRAKKTLTQNPKFPPPTQSSSSSSSSKQLQKKHPRNPTKKQPRQIWVKKETRRNWLELPRDVMLDIFLKLGVIEILFAAQSVCFSWRDIARDPVLYRRLDLSNPWGHFNECDFEPIIEMALQAIDRSRGQVEDFSITYFGTDEMLRRIVDNSCRLKKLRLASCYEVSDDALVEAVANLPCLEEVELCLCSFSLEAIEAVGKACPRLRLFRLNRKGSRIPFEEVNFYDSEALAIAGTMPGVTSLHLFGNRMTNTGLEAILDNCPHLEYLDLRQCFNLDLSGDLGKRCRAIKMLKLPDDSTEGYEFDTTIDHSFRLFDDDYDEDYESDFSYDDFTNPFNDLRLSGVDNFADLLMLDAFMGSDSDDFPDY